MTLLERLRAAEVPLWLVGALLAALIALAQLLGMPLVRDWEARATDLLFRYGRPEPPAPSDRIVHLDIDDGSLDTIGRWPWPRSLLAKSIEIIDSFGARVIALDILLAEPQDPQYLKDGTLIDHDALLTRTLAETRAKVILAVALEQEQTKLGPLWRTKEGRAHWRGILDLLETDITLRPSDLAGRLGLDPPRANRVQNQISRIKRIAIREKMTKLDDLSVDALRAALLPEGTDISGDFPEMVLIRHAVTEAVAAAAFERRLPDARPDVRYRHSDTVTPPLPAFAEAADGAGFVSAHPDPDGQMRRVLLRWERRGKIYPQFGLAAAAAYLDLDLDTLAAPVMDFNGVRFERSTMLLSWPRIHPVKHALGFAKHMPLALVVDLVEKEAALERTVAKQAPLTRSLVRDWLAGDWTPEQLDDQKLVPEIEAALIDELEFQLDGEEEEDETEGDKRKRRQAREWLDRRQAIHRAGAQLVPARARILGSLKDKIVFVGWNAEGNFGDFYPTVAHERTPGVVAHAIVANTILTGYVVRPAPAWVGALLALVLGLGTALVTSRVGPRLALLLTILIAVVYCAVNTLVVFDGMGVAMAMASPLAAILASWAGTTVVQIVTEQREKAQLRKQFGARISGQLFEYLIEHPDQVHLEGQEREVTCFFSDLAGFTSISEKLDSVATVSLLNRYMWEMNDELTKLHAYVNKFLGDGIMAVWGAFVVDTPHAERACRAALGCAKRLRAFNRKPEFAGLPRLSMRIGIATGVVTVGDCGAPPDLRDYTVIGDSANLAARLESANKQFGSGILVNGRTKEFLPDDIVTRPLGRITVVGQRIPTDIHEVLALRDEATDEQRRLVDRTARAVELFSEAKFADAHAAWSAFPDSSKLAALYLAAIERQLRHPDEEFDAVLRLVQK